MYSSFMLLCMTFLLLPYILFCLQIWLSNKLAVNIKPDFNPFTQTTVASLYLMTLFLIDRNNARYLWKRIPQAIKSVSRLALEFYFLLFSWLSALVDWRMLRCFSYCCIQANPELAAIWAVGQRIWQRDFPGIYTAIAAFQWSESILPVMEALRGNNTIRVLSNLQLLKWLWL